MNKLLMMVFVGLIGFTLNSIAAEPAVDAKPAKHAKVKHEKKAHKSSNKEAKTAEKPAQ